MPKFTLNETLWTLYCALAEDYCGDPAEKQRIMRCALKNCYSSLALWLGYLTEIEKSCAGDLSELESVVG